MTHARAPRARTLDPRPVSVRTPSVLVMSHSHPKLTRGGAEISALALFRGIKERGARAWFLGCGGIGSEQRLGAALTQPYGADDYVYTPAAPFDYFKFANPDPHFPRARAELVAELRPDIVHAHHYARFGVEMLALIKRVSPTTRIVVSLHEYLALCHNFGQMVKTGSGRLCERESPAECARCFPQIAAADFFLRKRYIQSFFEHVDLFLAPSQFLAERYIAWGIPPARITVLENMPPETRPMAADPVMDDQLPARGTSFAPAVASGGASGSASGGGSGGQAAQLQSGLGGTSTAAMRGRLPAPQSAVSDGLATGSGAQIPSSRAARELRATGPLAALPRRRRVRVGFFGQLSPLKGIGVLIEAAKKLVAQDIDGIEIVIHGDYSSQPEAFQDFVKQALADAPPNVSYMGPYDNQDVGRLMQRVDAVVTPSIWWENSPVVIQEAFANGRPVICSNVGGMAEKVRHGRDGLHFEIGRADSLARLFANLAEHPEVLTDLAGGVTRPLDAAAALQAHLNAYARIM
jgi:glycosyltransferase involved in cell wall biosynthesis